MSKIEGAKSEGKTEGGKPRLTLAKLVDKDQGLDTYWHKESQLVFKSGKERLVIGRYVEKEFIPLDQEALDLCETWKFKYDESLVAEAAEEEVAEAEPEAAEEEEEQVKPEVKEPAKPVKKSEQNPQITPEAAAGLFVSFVTAEADKLVALLKNSQESDRLKALTQENEALKAKLSALQEKIGRLLQ